MKIIRPIEVTSGILTTNVAETVSAYNAGTTYAAGDYSRNTSTNHVFLSAAAANTGRALTDRAWWIDTGVSNPFKMFDLYNNSQTTNTTAINVTVAVDGRIDSVVLFNLSAISVTIKAVAADGPSRTNRALRSQEFDNASWSKTNVTVTANDIVAPDGTLTADKIAASSTAATTISQTITAGATGAHVYSIYVKQGSGATDANRFGLRNNTTATNLSLLSVDYSTGLVTHTVGSGATMTAWGDEGWWRLDIPAASGITSGNSLIIYSGFAGASETNGEYSYVWGAQLEAGSTATDYIATTTAAVTTTDFFAKFQTYSLRETALVTDWYSYFFEEITYRTALSVTDIPAYLDMDVSVNIASTVGGTAGCGTCVIGLSKEFGSTALGVQFGIDDLSIKTKDEWGQFTILERPYSDRITIPVFLFNSELNAFKQVVAAYRAIPTVYIASELYDPAMVFGFFKSFNVDIAYNDYSTCTLEIEGVT